VLARVATLDLALAAALAVAAGCAQFALSAWNAPFVVHGDFDNLYFQADCALVFSNMSDFASNHYRTGMHPLFSLLLCPLTTALSRLTGLEPTTSVRLVLALNSSAWMLLSYAILRGVALKPGDATIFTLLLLVSAASMFWGSVPETFAFGGSTLLLMLAIIVFERRARSSVLVLGNVATMSMTLTNWFVGLSGSLLVLWPERRRWLRVVISAAAIVVALGIVSKLVFPSSGYVGDFRRYLQWLRLPRTSDLGSFFVHGMLMPEPIFRLRGDGLLEAVAEPATPGSGSSAGLIAAAGWLALLALGVGATILRTAPRRFAAVLLSALSAQLALHLFFADGPFLFCAHFVPLLLLAAAQSVRFPKFRWGVRAIAGGLVLLVGYNNWAVFERMTERFERELLPRLQRHDVRSRA
jgi:hypothetical protein